ncbi:MAG: hypothetical protein KC467_08505 [Marinomonas atlantica]|nr:hypothetical protein [Marinomonas atlantica]
MSESQLSQVQKLDKIRAAWLPAVEFLFGLSNEEAQFVGFEVNSDIAKPEILLESEELPCRYKIRMPARGFSNDVMLLADVVQELVRGLYPLGKDDKATVLSEGTAVYGAITAIKQVFGEETLDSYLNALKDNGFAYYDAFSYVAVLLTDEPKAIVKLREIKPFLYQVEREDFAAVGIELDRKIADILTYTFRA